ncbi:MAG: hypothetical protein MK098_10435 [Marinovum sp.]|nr:hypothetical protein [Marinovum sp.]
MMTYLPAFALLLLGVLFGLSPLLTPDFGGFEADQFPIPQTNPPVQPAGYAFAIWSVIYLWLIAGLIYSMIRRADDPAWAPMRLPLGISLGVGTVWLSVALVSPAWATVLIWIMWAPAVIALLRAPQFDWGWAEGPIGLYAGWLTAASCVALGLMAAGYGVLADVPAALAALALALLLAVLLLRFRPRAWSFAAAFIWALVGIIVRNGVDQPWVSGAAAVAIAMIALELWIQRDATT